MQLRTLLVALALTGPGLALPPHTTLAKRQAAATVEAIMPKSASCAGRGAECTTAADAAPFLATSMAAYGVVAGVPQAGILALIAYESGELQYKKNLDQAAQPGRGTANMQSGAFNVAFAAALGLGVFTPATVLSLMATNNKFNFGSGAWFYHTHCSVTQTHEHDADAWFASYLSSDCVGVGDKWNTTQPDRWGYWMRAKAVFNLK